MTTKMHINFFKKNKKSFMAVNELIILVLAVPLFIGMIWFFYKLQGAILSDPDDGSIANFDRLYEEIVELMESSDSTGYKEISYFIPKDKMLVGFGNKPGQDTLISMSLDISLTPDPIYKPSACGNSACLCLYDGVSQKEEEKNTGVIKCRRDGISDKKLIFTSPGLFHIPLEPGHSRIKQIYIEKSFDGFSNNYIIRIANVLTP